MNDEDLLHFLIGSSIFVTLYPFLYLSYAYNKLSTQEVKALRIKLDVVFVTLPIAFGIVFALTYRLTTFVPRVTANGLYVRFVVAGALSSLILSLIAHYAFNIQTEWLHMENPNASHIFIPFFYFILFYTVGLWIRALIRYGTTKPSLSPPKPPVMPKAITKPKLPTSSSSKSTTVFDRLAVKK